MALMLPFITPILPLLLLVPLTTAADADRLGSLQATLPLRYVGGRTIVSPGIGTPPQPIPLVLSPDVSYLTVVGHCTTCLQDGTEYDASSSTSAHVESGRSFNMTLPGRTGNASETLTLGGMIVRDTLSVNNDSIQLPEGTCSIRKIMSIVDATGGAAALGQGALIPAACPPNGSVTIGFDLKNSSAPAGDMHWGGVPSDAYQGRFNWLATSESNWAVGTDGFRVGPIEINVKKSSTAVLDPGLDDIFVPSAVAESFYESLGGERDKVYTERWNLPCDLSTDVRVRLSGVSYNLATSSLVVPRDKLGRTCWGSVVAWSNGSVPETEGEIRLGAAFISGVYMAMTYNCDNKERHIGLAAKPHSANPNNVYVAPKSNRKTIAIVLGVLLPLLALLLLCCLFCLCRKRLPFRRRPHEHEHEHEHEYEHEHEHYGCTHGVPGQCPGCAPVSVPISGLVHIPPHHASRTSTPSPRFQEVPLLNPAPVRSPRFQEVPLPNPPACPL
ncbi:hypothetical protein CspeluHIS016_0306000 [Cutaneotrichosporon spelunceum]|uniref:Peptidase A1 domain-containing protein n=1 Tax=Cutaneotrichosporon spelunceum TaxID=1672016 RepID=A0AAD3TTS4_9TREE|nr:hypothetical protein CspeluHIS016_0306000 [Cutaneotrichosporon spelunceum]